MCAQVFLLWSDDAEMMHRNVPQGMQNDEVGGEVIWKENVNRNCLHFEVVNVQDVSNIISMCCVGILGILIHIWKLMELDVGVCWLANPLILTWVTTRWLHVQSDTVTQ